VPKPPREPLWLNRIIVDSIHNDQVREHGGLPGLRDENALESALARPRHKWAYSRRHDPASLAAAYGYSIVRNHPYVDGNKRVGFLAIVTFLGINGFDFIATDAEVLNTIVELAAGRVSEENLTDWIRRHSVRS
jgi:death-on-curing protein